ncbi:hypothetical protein [Microbacterium trichothecenolyticum]|uniref:Fibronectin type-III domain-containing protein n=1 Tax=Microbacterium trichothecenolyticum TaxID=69370 RepID=A0ABU0TZ35_MICTR|nr:hypothetical protein [Microbacterium trichothecenolyticum]MDQ1124921.1 hypothetical protein [Microbacterium trichothecenolyticum]
MTKASGERGSAAPAVELDAPVEEFSDVVDARGERLRVVSEEGRGSADRSAVALTEDDEAVLLKSLHGDKDPSSLQSPSQLQEAREPGLDGWVEGENYFVDGRAQTSTQELAFDDIAALDESSLDVLVSTATGSSSFSAAWAADGATSYEIYRDGQFVTKTDRHSFADAGLESDRDYVYVARAADGSTAGTETIFQAHTLPSDASRIAQSSRSPVQTLAVPREASWFVYNTFIQQDKVAWDIYKAVGGQCAGVPGDQYGGDNRSFRTPLVGEDPWASGSLRTGARVKIDFGSAAVIEQKNVGTTYLYNSSGGVKETRTASTAGITFSERSVGATLYKVRIQQQVGNPFCQYGAIRANVYVNIWKSGTMQINGSRHPVPAHEAYGLFTNSSGGQYWLRMYEGAQGDFHCVSGTCPEQVIGRTHTPS